MHVQCHIRRTVVINSNSERTKLKNNDIDNVIIDKTIHPAELAAVSETPDQAPSVKRIKRSYAAVQGSVLSPGAVQIIKEKGFCLRIKFIQ